MAHAGRVFGNGAWIARLGARSSSSAPRCGAMGLAATYKDGRAHLNAYLDDYAFLIAAQLELLQDEFSVEALEFATQLADVLLEQFEDPTEGGFFFTAREHERLIHRPKPARTMRRLRATPSPPGR